MALAWVLVTLAAAAAVWARHRGLDVTDEGYNLLGIRPGQRRVEVLSDAFQLVVTLAGGREWGLGTWRLISATLIIAGAGGFGLALRRFVRARALAGPLTSGSSLPAVCAFAGLFTYGFFAPTLSYNTLTLALTYAAAALVLAALSDRPTEVAADVAEGTPSARRTGGRRALLAAGAAGALVTVQYFVKPPAAIALSIALVTFAVLARREHNHPGLGAGFAAAVAGMATAAGIYFAVVRSPSEYATLLSEQLRVVSETSHNSGALIAGYFDDTRALARLGAGLLGSYVAAGLVGWAGARAAAGRVMPRAATVAVWVVAALAVASTAYHAWSRGMLAPPRRVFDRAPLYVCWLLLVPALWLGTWLAARQPGVRSVRSAFNEGRPTAALALHGLLVALPFVCAAGTNNDLYGQATFFATGWVASCTLLLERVAAMRPLRLVGYGALALLLVGVGEELADGLVLQPHRLLAPRDQQTTRVRRADPAVGPVYLDARTAPLVDSLVGALRRAGFRRGDPVLGLYDMPGVVYLVGGTSPGALWFSSRPEEQGRNCYLLRQASLRPGQPLVVLLNLPVAERTQACMRALGIAPLDSAQPLVTLPLRNLRLRASSEPLRAYRVTVGAPAR